MLSISVDAGALYNPTASLTPSLPPVTPVALSRIVVRLRFHVGRGLQLSVGHAEGLQAGAGPRNQSEHNKINKDLITKV